MLTPSTENRAGSGRVACLFSGGLDSAVMLAELARNHSEVIPLYVRCGLAWEAAERSFLQRFLERVDIPAVRPLQVLDFQMNDLYGLAWYASGKGVPGYHDADENWEIPGRNIVLLSKAAVWCALHSVPEIALGVLASNPFPDATPRFFSSMETALSIGLNYELSILRPLASLHKCEVVRLGRGLPLELTLSCATPWQDRHCGRCGKCRERIEAFAAAGIDDPTAYGIDVASSQT